MNLHNRPISISSNGRYLQRADGTPFFYLADTAWELLHRCTLDEAEMYLHDRAAKGFTVIQTVLLAELDGLRVPTPSGQLPLHDEDLTRPDESYFAHVDAVFDIAESLGLTIGLLPTWGDKWNLMWGIGPELHTTDGWRAFGEYAGRRFAHRNVIWILGGDRPIETSEHLAIVRALAEGVRVGDEGRNLMTAHTWGQHSTSEYYGDESWLEFNTVQSGHGRNFENWRMIEADYARSPVMPCMDMEPAYEESADQIGNLGGGFLDDYEVRKGLYWALFAGAHGHTYGCWPVWQMWDVGREPRMWVRKRWQEALQLPGAGQVRHAKDLLLSRPYFERIPDQSMILGEPSNGVYHAQATRDRSGSFAFVFSPAGVAVQVTLENISGERYRGWWFDPRTGEASLVGEGSTGESQTFTPPSGGPDWVLVIDSVEANYGPPGAAMSVSR